MPFVTLQEKIFELINRLMSLTPSTICSESFNIKTYLDNPSINFNIFYDQLVHAIVYYSLGSVVELTIPILYWSVIVKQLYRKTFGIVQGHHTEYNKNTVLINIILYSLQRLSFGAGPYSDSKKNVDIDLSQEFKKMIMTVFFEDIDPNNDRTLTCSINVNTNNIIASFNNDSVDELILQLIQIEGYIDSLMHKIEIAWIDLRSGGHSLPIKFDSLDPLINLYSHFPEEVAKDGRLSRTLFSLEYYNDGYASNKLKDMFKEKRFCKLISDIKKNKRGYYTPEIESYVDRNFSPLEKVYDVCKKKGLFEKSSKSIETFLTKRTDIIWSHKEETIQDVSVLLPQNDNRKKRIIADMMNILIEYEFGLKLNARNVVEPLIDSLKEKRMD